MSRPSPGVEATMNVAYVTNTMPAGVADAEWNGFKAALDRELEEESVPRLTTQHGGDGITRKGVVFRMKAPVARPDRVCINRGPPIHIDVDLEIAHEDAGGRTPTAVFYAPCDKGAQIVIKWSPTTAYTKRGDLAGRLDSAFAVIKGAGHLVFDHVRVVWTSAHSVSVGLTADQGVISENPGASAAGLSFIYDRENEALIFSGLMVTPRDPSGIITHTTESSAHHMAHDILSGMSPDERAEWDKNMALITKDLIADAESAAATSPPQSAAAVAGLVFLDEATPAMLGIVTPPDQVGTSNASASSSSIARDE